MIDDPFNFLNEYLSNLRNEIHLKNEIKSLVNYEELLGEIDNFEESRRDFKIENLKECSDRVELSKKIHGNTKEGWKI